MDFAEQEMIVRARLKEAYHVLRCLQVSGLRPAAPTSLWPACSDEEKRSIQDVLAYIREKRKKQDKQYAKKRLTPAEISRMDEALGWMFLPQNEEERKALTAWAFCKTHPVSFQRFSENVLGVKENTARARAGRAARDIVLHLMVNNASIKQPDIAATL
ncbi:hypothetical protein ACQU0X_28780 [Pseudovibrio ascidiaceicola]|uniref:hypothetical protein n=1 Tax=Pseudovibrio ascidiaceicola TaxID=285279 RepID=UPI003D3673B8